MAVIDAKNRTIQAKLVYYGTALGGKTTNLLVLHRLAEADQKQKLVSLNTSGDRTLFFDLLPFDLGDILDWRLKLKLYTVPGQPEYNETRRIVLANTDAIVFVADSDPERQAENVRSINFFKLNLQQNQLDPDTLPVVFQYNKRDLPTAMPSQKMETELNWRHAPYYMATALRGDKVLETFEDAVTRMTLDLIHRHNAKTRGVASPEAVGAAVHAKLKPLYERYAERVRASEVVGEVASSRRMVVSSTRKDVNPDSPRARPLDTQDLLQSALEHEMSFLNEMLDQDLVSERDAAEANVLEPERLTRVLTEASKGNDLAATVTPFVALAMDIASAAGGTVLALTAGEGPLAELARLGTPDEPLNIEPPFGGMPAARRIIRDGQPLYGQDLSRTTSTLTGRDRVPYCSLPLEALGRKVGLLTLHAAPDQPELSDPRKRALETIAGVLALALAVRGLERRLAAQKPVSV